MEYKAGIKLNLWEHIQLRSMLIVLGLLHALGFKGLTALGNFLGALTWYLAPARRRYTRQAVEKHLGVASAEARRIAKASFKHNIISFLEAALVQDFRLSGNPRLLPLNDNFQNLLMEERPVVACTAHIGGWELLAGLLPDVKVGTPQAVIVRKQQNRALNELIFRMRSSAGGEVVGHRRAAPVVIKALRQNGVTAFLVDHNTSRDEGIFLPFLGEPASVNQGPAMLALRGKAIVYPLFLIRQPGGTYLMLTDEPLDTSALTGSISERVRQIAEFYTKAVEEVVRKHPEQWFWMHKRWKTQPHPADLAKMNQSASKSDNLQD